MAQSSPPSSRQWVRKALPLVGSALILVYYFHGQNWPELWDKTKQADRWLAVLAVAVPQLVFWYFETLVTQRHLTWFHGPFSFKEYFWTRGAIYILMLINTPLGGGGAMLYIKRKARITWKKLIGIMLFRFGLTMWGLDLFLIPATLLVYRYGLADRMHINLVAWWALLIGGLFWLCEAWLFWHHGKHIGVSRFVVRDRMSEFWSAFQNAPPRRWFLTWAMTMPPLMIMLLGLYLLAVAFHVQAPFWEFMAVAPLLFLIIDMPFALAGFGATTMAWKLFFPDYGNPDAVMALTLFFPLVRGLTRALIGLACLRPALRDLSSLFKDGEPTGNEIENK